jgi:uncharacterized DUF497 family protein
MQLILDIIGFEWDDGNRSKNRALHKVEWWECEETFFNFPLYLFPDYEHSQREERFFAFGHTNSNRFLTIVFTVRQKRIRVISARDMNRRERRMYNEKDPTL